jgi:hypothetical protein
MLDCPLDSDFGKEMVEAICVAKEADKYEGLYSNQLRTTQFVGGTSNKLPRRRLLRLLEVLYHYGKPKSIVVEELFGNSSI